MIVILSPAKTMDMKSEITQNVLATKPVFENEASNIHNELAKLDKSELITLMSLSPKLADDILRLIDNFNITEKRPALFSYSGAVYKNLAPYTLTGEYLEYANERIYILSGMYGVLKPSDLISPYRLEMKTRLKTHKGNTLNKFWSPVITDFFKEKDTPIINLASKEYYGIINQKEISKPFITIEFRERQNGKIKSLATYAKMARGLMTRYIIDNKIIDPEHIKGFNQDGYAFDEKMSSEYIWFFVR